MFHENFPAERAPVYERDGLEPVVEEVSHLVEVEEPTPAGLSQVEVEDPELFVLGVVAQVLDAAAVDFADEVEGVLGAFGVLQHGVGQFVELVCVLVEGLDVNVAGVLVVVVEDLPVGALDL